MIALMNAEGMSSEMCFGVKLSFRIKLDLKDWEDSITDRALAWCLPTFDP